MGCPYPLDLTNVSLMGRDVARIGPDLEPLKKDLSYIGLRLMLLRYKLQNPQLPFPLSLLFVSPTWTPNNSKLSVSDTTAIIPRFGYCTCLWLLFLLSPLYLPSSLNVIIRLIFQKHSIHHVYPPIKNCSGSLKPASSVSNS